MLISAIPACLRRFCLLCLVVLSSQAPAQAAPAKVTVGVYLVQCTGVDLKNSVIGLDFYVWFRWQGDAVKPQETWELMNGRVVSKTSPVVKKIGSDWYAMQRVQAQLNQLWELHSYPLDQQNVHLDIEDNVSGSEHLIYVADDANTAIDPLLRVPGWQLEAHQSEVSAHVYTSNYGDTSVSSGSRSTYSRYSYGLQLSRFSVGRFVKVFFPLLMATFTSWLSFLLGAKDNGPRVSIGLGALFASAAASLAINNALPENSVTTMADRLITVCLCSIFLSCLVTVLTIRFNHADKEDLSRTVDRVSLGLFPLVFVLSLVFYVLR